MTVMQESGELDALIQSTLRKIVEDVEALPRSSFSLVGALVSINRSLTEPLRQWLLHELISRADTQEVTPAAEAMMRLGIYGEFADEAFAQEEIRRQFSLLKALHLDSQIHVASRFMEQLAERLELIRTPGDRKSHG